MSQRGTDPLRSLAAACNVEPGYSGIDGVWHDASPEALIAVLRALGLPIDRPEDAPSARRALRAKGWSRVLEPVVVAWDGTPGAGLLRLPEAFDDSIADCRVTLEDGSTRDWRTRVGDLPVAATTRLGSRTTSARRLPLPDALPFGAHRLEVFVAGAAYECEVLATPSGACTSRSDPLARTWGTVIPLSALRTFRSAGTGDLGDLADVARWSAGRGAEIVASLPLLAAFLREPCEPSPYAPVSRRFWNEMYLDLERIPDLRWSPKAAALLSSPGMQKELASLRATTRVAFARVAAAKRRVLKVLVEGLADGPAGRQAEFRSWVAGHADVADYARFRAAGERFGTNWRSWPAMLRDGHVRFADVPPSAEAYHRYVQWVTEEQLAAVSADLRRRGQTLGFDLPVGAHPDGYDVWRDRAQYVDGISAGAPPDGFFPGGQSWGFPPLHPDASRVGGHGAFRAALAHHLRHAGLLRIDHVMVLHRLLWVPDGMSPEDGVYVRYPADELWAALCLEAHRHKADIVGEDLGTVPDEVREAMRSHRARTMTVAQFDLDPNAPEPIRPPRPGSVMSWGTHDLPTFAGWWEARDVARRETDGILTEQEAAGAYAERAVRRDALWRASGGEGEAPAHPPREALDRMVETMGASEASVVLMSVEDLWLEPESFNAPGTVSPDNWTGRARLTLEELDADEPAAATLARLAATRPWEPLQPPAAVVGEPLHDVSLLTPYDVHLLNEGRHYDLAAKLGAHIVTHEGLRGIFFAVWAPDAASVGVIGDFNAWSDGRHPLHPVGSSGIWEGFVPGIAAGSIYKYRIRSRHGNRIEDKADPLAFAAEESPRTASVVWDLDYEWRDAVWMATRAKLQRPDQPISIYEVHLGSWARVSEEGDRPLTYREIAPRLADHVLALGFTHVELMPVMEHPFYGSWGYQVTGYFAPTSRYGSPQDLMAMIDHLHQRGIGVILDWVPSHFPADAHGLAEFDGTHLYEHADPRQRIHPDWGSSLFNYGRNEIRSFLVSAALFWLEHYHADGLRMDAVASMLYLDYSRVEGEWVPNRYGGRENLEALQFLRDCSVAIGDRYPEALTFAEESTAWPGVTRPVHLGGLGFHYKWDMGWMHDTLAWFARDPVHRGFHLEELTFRMLYAGTEQFVLPLSHDEVVHGKGSLLSRMPGDDWQRFANLRLLLAYQYALPGKKLLFMGSELAQWVEWNHERSLDWHLLDFDLHAGMCAWVGALNRLYRDVPALHQGDTMPHGFAWIDCHDREHAVLSMLRTGDDPLDPAIVVLNLTPVPREGYVIGAPLPGRWDVVACSDASEFGGSDYPVARSVEAREPGWHERPYALELELPPLGAVILRRAPG